MDRARDQTNINNDHSLTKIESDLSPKSITKDVMQVDAIYIK